MTQQRPVLQVVDVSMEHGVLAFVTERPGRLDDLLVPRVGIREAENNRTIDAVQCRNQGHGICDRVRLQGDRVHRDDQWRRREVDPDLFLHAVERGQVRPPQVIQRWGPGHLDAPVVLAE